MFVANPFDSEAEPYGVATEVANDWDCGGISSGGGGQGAPEEL